MSKISIEEVEAALKQNKVDQKIIQDIVKHLETVVEENKSEKTAPKTKNELVVILSDPDKKIDGDFTAWVAQIKSGDDAGTVLSRIKEAIQDWMHSRKRKKDAVNTLGDGISGVKRAFLKEKNIAIKTKTPVRVILADNKL